MEEFNLTPRQYEILLILSTGASNKQIAEQLYINKRTVESHVSAILFETSSLNRAEVVSKYLTQPEIFKVYKHKSHSKYMRIINLFNKKQYTLSEITEIVDTSYNYVSSIVVKYKNGLIKI